MTEEDTNSPNAYSRTLQGAIERMHKRRSEMIQAKIARGGPDEATHIRFEEAVLTMFYELRPFAIDHPQAGSDWAESGVESLPQICGRVEETEKTDFSGGFATYDTNVEIKHAEPSTLLEASEIMDKIAHKLGFAPSTDSKTPIYHLSHDDYDEPVKETIPKPE